MAEFLLEAERALANRSLLFAAPLKDVAANLFTKAGNAFKVAGQCT